MGCPRLKTENWRFISAETAGRKRPYLFHPEKNRSRSAPAEMDDRSEVTSAVSANDSTYDFSFNFDPIGNRTSSASNETGSTVTTSYTTNELNQYTNITNPSQSPTYDTDGNMLTMTLSTGAWTNTFNAENRIIAQEKSDARLEYVYDYMGRRVEKKVYSGSVGNWTLASHKRFVYDNYQQIEELDPLNSNAIAKKRIWGLDKLIAETQGTTAYYALGDANKNITEYLDSTGTIQAHYEYSPFGKITKKSGTMQDEFDYRFSSEVFDTETGLSYYTFRYYSPELGRWLSRDPIGVYGGFNLYGMVSNRVINAWDLLGFSDISSCCEMVDDLVRTAVNNNKWWKGPDWMQRALTANDIANRYVPDSMRFQRFAAGGNLTGGYNHNITGHSGFNPVLTQGGQNNAVYRHIGFNAAAVLNATTILSEIAEFSEGIQALGNISDYMSGNIDFNELMEQLDERQAEVEGDKAGRNTGQLIEEYLDEEISESELREKLLKELCGC